MPRLDYGAYPQMPVEAITEEQYKEMASKIDTKVMEQRRLESLRQDEMQVEKFCDGDSCLI